MTLSLSKIFTSAIALSIASCAQPAQEAQVTKSAVSTPKPQPAQLKVCAKITSISLPDLFTLQQSGRVLLYDARPGFYYHLGHLPGALSLPKSGCDVQIAQRQTQIKAALAAKKTIVIYCTNLACPDARTVAAHLANLGYPCSTLTGGWEAWKESGLPTE
jgi:rhodanese-related sulfurtransferase